VLLERVDVCPKLGEKHLKRKLFSILYITGIFVLNPTLLGALYIYNT